MTLDLLLVASAVASVIVVFAWLLAFENLPSGQPHDSGYFRASWSSFWRHQERK